MSERANISNTLRPATTRGRPYLFALLAAACACGGPGARPHDIEGAKPRGPAAAPLSLEGIDARFERGDPVRRLQAAQVLVAPRQSGFFRMGGLYELVLTQVRIDLALDDAGARRGAGPAGASPLAASPLAPAPARAPAARAGRIALPHVDGAVVAGTLYDVVCVAARAGQEVTRATARTAQLDLRTGDLALRDLVVEHHPTGRVLEAPRATWRSRQRDLLVPGEYRMQEGSAVRSGRGALLDLELRATSDPARR